MYTKRILLAIALLVVRLDRAPAQSSGCDVENELSRSPTNCHQYVRCLDGEQVVFGCTDGKVFNPTTKQCVASDEYACLDEVSYTEPWATTPPPTTPPPTTTTADPLCLAASEAIVVHPTDCDKYVTCEDGIAMIGTCPEGQHLSWKTLSCRPGYTCEGYFEDHGKSLESEACQRQALPLAEHPYEAYRYVECANLRTRSCADGEVFRQYYQRCLPGSWTTNALRSVSAGCGFWGVSAHPYLCEKYFSCKFWISSLRSCPAGQIYDVGSRKCLAGDFRSCQFA